MSPKALSCSWVAARNSGATQAQLSATQPLESSGSQREQKYQFWLHFGLHFGGFWAPFWDIFPLKMHPGFTSHFNSIFHRFWAPFWEARRPFCMVNTISNAMSPIFYPDPILASFFSHFSSKISSKWALRHQKCNQKINQQKHQFLSSDLEPMSL